MKLRIDIQGETIGVRFSDASTQIHIRVMDWGKNKDGEPRTLVRVSAPILRGVPPSPQLYEYLCREAPRFYFGSSQHRRAMSFVEYGLHQSEGFIVVTGEVGAGKTTVVRNLLARLDPTQVVAANLVSTQLDAEDILQLVAAAFGVRTQGLSKAQTLLSLEGVLASHAKEGRRCLLVVDEAQNLSPRAVEELRMLSNFQLGTHALLQSFLVGQPEFRLILQSPEMHQLRQRVIAACHIGPLDAKDTRRKPVAALAALPTTRQTKNICRSELRRNIWYADDARMETRRRDSKETGTSSLSPLQFERQRCGGTHVERHRVAYCEQ